MDRMQNSPAVKIRRVRIGDEAALAYIQTESWKAAFKDILDPETLTRCTDIHKAEAMYKGLLEQNKGNGYLLTLDDRPHCFAWWDAARDADMLGWAELIAIHSLSSAWGRGYGSMMMDQVLSDIKADAKIPGPEDSMRQKVSVFSDTKNRSSVKPRSVI